MFNKIKRSMPRQLSPEQQQLKALQMEIKKEESKLIGNYKKFVAWEAMPNHNVHEQAKYWKSVEKQTLASVEDIAVAKELGKQYDNFCALKEQEKKLINKQRESKDNGMDK